MIQRRTRSPRAFLSALLPAFLLVGCGTDVPQVDQSPDALAPAPAEAPLAGEVPDGLQADRLMNATLQLPMVPGLRIVLRDGSFERTSPLLLVTLDGGSWVAADFDADGAMEAAALVRVTQDTGQSPSVFTHLVVFGLGGRTLSQEAVLQLPLNARVAEIRSVGVFVDIDLVEEQPGDRRCCPTGRRTMRYRLVNGAFEPA